MYTVAVYSVDFVFVGGKEEKQNNFLFFYDGYCRWATNYWVHIYVYVGVVLH